MTQITVRTKTYDRTESGKSWKKQASSTETEIVTEENYWNRANRDALRFWNGFCGGTCRATYGYTCIGYVPVRITRVNPDGSKKIVEEFLFQVNN